MRRDLDKWASTRKSALFEGKGSPMEVTNWDNMMVTYFTDNVITNSILQSKLAAQTFRGLASNWWRAHQQLVPEMVVSYEQLLEWIRTEFSTTSRSRCSYLVMEAIEVLGRRRRLLEIIRSAYYTFPITSCHLVRDGHRTIKAERQYQRHTRQTRCMGMTACRMSACADL